MKVPLNEISGSRGDEKEGMLRRVAWQKLSDVSEELTASIVRANRVSTSKMSVSTCQTIWRNFPEDSHLQVSLNKILNNNRLWEWIQCREIIE
jgi:hypothetical protein